VTGVIVVDWMSILMGALFVVVITQMVFLVGLEVVSGVVLKLRVEVL
jgi:hypothetical protein